MFFTQTLERQVTSHLSENNINTPETSRLVHLRITQLKNENHLNHPQKKP